MPANVIYIPPMHTRNPADQFSKHMRKRTDNKNDVMTAMDFLVDVYSGNVPDHIPEINDTNVTSAMSTAAMNAGFYTRATKDFCSVLADFLGDDAVVLDPFAGRGYLSKGLHDEGVSVIASDDFSWDNYAPDEIPAGIENMPAMSSVRSYAASATHLIIAWPPPTVTIDLDVAISAQEINPDIKIIHIGESVNGCTGSKEFWDVYERDESASAPLSEYKSTDYLYDRASLIARKK